MSKHWILGLLPVISLFCLLLSGCISVSVLPARGADDGSASLTAADRQRLRPFDAANVNRPVPYRTKADVRFELIAHRDVQAVVASGKPTLVLLWASWCGVCHGVLQKVFQAQDSLLADDVQVLVISQNFNLPSLAETLHRNKARVGTYILDPGVYGTDEIAKQRQFGQAICPSCTDPFEGAVPRMLLFGRDGTVLADMPGTQFSYGRIKVLLRAGQQAQAGK